MGEIFLGLLGCGTVGTGVAKMLINSKDILHKRTGKKFTLKRIADIDTKTDRGINFNKGVLVNDAQTVINDPEIDIIIEMIGGEKTAKELILKAIDNGKHIITANKALLAGKNGFEIFKAAKSKGVFLGYEASVGGCMPIIKTIRESLVGNKINSISGILNGTCNYILSKITDEGLNFDKALFLAQKAGFAEADPALDIEGHDTAHKLAILSAIAYGIKIDLNEIFVEGISKISPLDIKFAKQFGYCIKLLAINKNHDNCIEARVHPTMIPIDNILSNVNDSLNAVSISGDASSDILICGHGAGMMPTASAVVSDIADIARNMDNGIKNAVPVLSYQPENIKKKPVLPMKEISTNYYIRFFATDKPGVLSKISGILGKFNISVKSVHQHKKSKKGHVPIVIFTHIAKEANIRKALKDISELDVIADTPYLIRIEETDN